MGDRVAKSRARGGSLAAQPLQSLLLCGPRAHLLRAAPVPAGNKAGIGGLGLLDPAPFLIAVALDVVSMSLALLTACCLVTRLQLEIAQLLGVQRGTRPGVALTLISRCQMMMVSLRAVATAATCWPLRARTRRKKARSGPGARAAAQAASTNMPRAWPRPRLVIRP